MRLLWSHGAESLFRPEDFFGREEELNTLLRICLEGMAGIGSSVLLFGPPNAGKTSVLLKLKTDLLGLPEGSAAPRPFPFYFSFSKILTQPLALSEHYLQEYLWQMAAFLGEPPPGAFDVQALCEGLTAIGHPECRECIEAHRRYAAAGDGLSALANAFSFPYVTGGREFYPVFLFDDFHFTARLQGVPEGAIFSILRPYVRSGRFPMVVSGSSPGRLAASLKREGLYGSFQLMEIGGLSTEAAVRSFGPLLGRRRISLPERLLPRAAARLGCVPVYQKMFAEEISFRNAPPADEIAFENLYALSVTEGKLNRYWREFFETSFPDRLRRVRAIQFLKRVLWDRFPLDTFEGALSLIGVSPEEGTEILRILEFKGIVTSDFEQLRFIEDPVLSDFLYWAFERGILGKGSSQVAAAIVQSKVSRSALDRGDETRDARSAGIKEMMRKWDCQEVPSLLFDFGRFRERFGGRGLLEVMIGLEGEAEGIRLPKISSVSTGYRTRRGAAVFDFDLVAYGFQEGDFSEDRLVIWAVDLARGPSLTGAIVEHFENRCRLLTLEKGLRPGQLQKWILFDGSVDEACLALATRFGIQMSHRSQLRLLLHRFGVEELERSPEARPEPGAAAGSEPLEFELVLPMKADTEVVAARVAEEVSAYASLDKDTVDRIKMAIIEACINAFEHSGSESGKVRLRYVLSPERIDLYVQDDGKGFRPPRGDEEGRRTRGWGLKLIRELVDDVEIETGERGTTVRMVKYLGPGDGPGPEPGEAERG